jgi:hypothetical protein
MGPALAQAEPVQTYKSPVCCTILASFTKLPVVGRSSTVATGPLRVIETPCAPVAPVGPGLPEIANFQLLKLEPPPDIKSAFIVTSVPTMEVITPSIKIVAGDGT